MHGIFVVESMASSYSSLSSPRVVDIRTQVGGNRVAQDENLIRAGCAG